MACPGLRRRPSRIVGGRVVRSVVMPICAVGTEKVGVPTSPDNRVPFDPIQTTKQRMEHRYKNSGVRVSVHRRLNESIDVVGQA